MATNGNDWYEESVTPPTRWAAWHRTATNGTMRPPLRRGMRPIVRVLRQHPLDQAPLTQADRDAAWAYYAQHRDEIEQAFRDNTLDADEDV
jgi:hypothetical protein